METNQERRLKKSRGLWLVAAVVIVALMGMCTWQFFEVQKLRDPDYAGEQAKIEAEELKDRVAKLMQLPDEDATVATVQDAAKLAGQDFFKDAKDGDKVLIFTAARKAVIYRPDENKIINSGPIVINSVGSTDTVDAGE